MPHFRPARASDRDSLQAMALAYYEEDGNLYGAPRVAAALDAVLAGEELARLWIIEQGGESIGYLCVTLGFALEAGGREFFIDEIYVTPDHRNRGIGGKAFAFALEECRKLGAVRVCLEVEKSNPKARRLYERLGFTAHERVLMSRFLDA